jgi:hypothetical protein
MAGALALLITLMVNPNYCSAPCTINTLIHLEFPAVQGELCLKLVPMESQDDDYIRRSCWDVDRTSPRFDRRTFLSVPGGTYVIYTTLDGKQVSNKPIIRVIGAFENESVKKD